jgi:predicted RNase H-like HicB family nuclease
MRFRVMLKKTDEGYAVWCPSLPGCWSQGETEEEALQNIRDAIEYLEAVQQMANEADQVQRSVEVSHPGTAASARALC